MLGMCVPARGLPLGARLAPAVRMLVCAAVPWYLCVWLGTSTAPVPAALPAVLILREDVFAAPRLAVERLAGVVAGVLLSVLVLHWLPPGGPSFAVLLVCGCAGMFLLGGPGSPNQQVLVTALVVYATPVPGYPLARLVESAVGIAVVVVLGPLLWLPDPYRQAAGGLEAYRSRLGAVLGRVRARAAAGRPTGHGPLDPMALWHRPYELSAALERGTGRLLLLPPRAAPDAAAGTLRGRLRLAARTAPALLFLTRELEARTADGAVGGAGAAGADAAVLDLAPLIGATSRALDAALGGADGADCAALLRRALDLEAEHRAAHPGRRDTALRAGLYLTHEALADHLARGGG
ncbi:FUSC family protein [Streptomyces sp. cmx-4-9]|uniref:FUSC family protein n=1 Tax=Streptomyces sp. cmx-4-9 TaxID=2790941 RepID=UPI0039811E1B